MDLIGWWYNDVNTSIVLIQFSKVLNLATGMDSNPIDNTEPIVQVLSIGCMGKLM